MHSISHDSPLLSHHSFTKENHTEPLPEEHASPAQEEVTHSTSQQAHHERQAQIAEWFKRRADLLNAPSDHTAQESDALHESKYGETKGFRPITEVIRQVASEIFYQTGKIIIGLGLLSLGGNVNPYAFIGINVGITAGEQLYSGSSYGWEKMQLSRMKAKLNIINQEIKKITDPNDPRLPVFKVQKQQLQVQIANQKAVLLKEGFALLKGGFMAALSTTVTLLQLAPTTNTAAQFSAGSGGVLLGGIGLGLSALALHQTITAYAATNQQLGDLGRIQSDESTSENVKNTVDLIDLAAMDYTANYQKNKVKAGIFQSAFATCSSAAGIGAGIIGILALANVAGITVAATVSGIGMPILGAFGALLTGAIYLVRNRKTISRGINGLFGPSNKGVKERLNLEQNLVIREWYAKKNLKNAVKEMEKLSFERSASSEKIEALDKRMLEKAGEIDQYRERVMETRYKKALQGARDKTPTIKMTKDAAIEANERALNDVNVEMAEVDKKIASLENPDKIEMLKNADSTRIGLLKQEYVVQRENLIIEQTKINAKLKELKPEVKKESVHDEKMMVADALVQNIEKLSAEELESLVSNCKKRNITFDNWDKSEPLEQQKRYIKMQILGAIAAGQVSKM